MSILIAADLYKQKILPLVDGKTDEWFARQLTLTARAHGAAAQAALATALLNIRDDKAGKSLVDTAHEIVTKQLERCAQFGERAYPLSENQIAVIARAVARVV